MNLKVVRGYFLAVVAALVLLAAAVLLIVQGPNTGKFSVYFNKDADVKIVLLMLFSALGGIVLLYCVRMLVCGLSVIVRARRDAATESAPTAESPGQSDKP